MYVSIPAVENTFNTSATLDARIAFFLQIFSSVCRLIPLSPGPGMSGGKENAPYRSRWYLIMGNLFFIAVIMDAMWMALYSLSKLRFASPYFTAMDCLLNGERAIYCSSELTSGLRQYNELRKHGIKSTPDLKKQLGDAWFKKNIFDPNVQSANAFAASVRQIQTNRSPVITPAPFEVQEWGQPEYLAFWEELIRTRVKAVRFNRNWEFSNGCTFEFVVAHDAGIRTLDVDGSALSPRAGALLIQEAIKQFADFDTTNLQEHLARLVAMGFRPSDTVRRPVRRSSTNGLTKRSVAN
jgi:hypothetical protein